MIPRSLSARYKEDFAYPTIKDRVPVILTKVIDTIHQTRSDVIQKYGEAGSEDVKKVIGLLSKLRNEIQTNKPLLPIEDDGDDIKQWNEYLHNDRRIREAIRQSKLLKSYDPFNAQKCQALVTSLPAVTSLVNFQQQQMKPALADIKMAQAAFTDFLQISLWGNKCDLSISAGVENSQKVDAYCNLSLLKNNLLADDTESVWSRLIENTSNIHIILDNAGFELITDLVLADFLISANLVKQITFHGKAIPWFVSDVTIDDLQWTLNELQGSQEEVLMKCGQRWRDYLDAGIWTYKASSFWTLPHAYFNMKEVAPALYQELSSADLLIFKGDLNYRKLTGDLKWPYSTKFRDALQGFLPSPLVALRTIKCDLVVGITEDQAREIEKKDERWLFDGSWGVIHYAD